jgi:hypothetical protein
MARRGLLTAGPLALIVLLLTIGGSSASATSSCPASDPGALVSQRPGASSSLVPTGASGLVVCEFNVIGYPGAGPRNGLIGSGQTSGAATVTQIAGALDALTMDANYPVACPADAGQLFVAYFQYAAGASDPVRLQLGGCDLTTNGIVSRLAIGSPVVGQITGLVQPSTRTPTTPLPLGPGPVVISRIAGELRLCGGPAPGSCHVESFTSCQPMRGCVRDDRVRIVRNGSAAATVRLKRGRFSIVVSPGRYTVELLQDGPGEHGTVVQSRTVVAPRYGTARVTFTRSPWREVGF